MTQRITVYDSYLNRVGMIWSWVSLVWTDSYNEGGSFQLEITPSEAVSEILKPDYMLRYSETGTLMVIESVQVTEGQMIVTGKDAGHLMSRRFVFGYTIGTKNAESTILKVFSANIDPWPNFEAGDATGLEQTFDGKYEYGDLETMLQSVAQEADIGYRVVFNDDSTKLLLQCYAPAENENAIFSTKFKNLGNITYTQSHADYKNICYVGSAVGNGGFAYLEIVGDDTLEGPDRREMCLEVEQGDEAASWTVQGENALLEQAPIENLECTITGDISLGEIATIRVPEIGITVKRRVTQIQITAQNGSIEKAYTIGDNILREA